MKVHVLRIGHRLVRDDRATTHAALVARAFGAERIYMTGIDQSVAQTVSAVGKRWGGQFDVEIIKDWKAVAKRWKQQGGTIVHLTMYGVDVNSAVKSLGHENVLVIIGSEKVPREAYDLADHNVSVGNQPHSEIAALAIFLDRLFRGKAFAREFSGGRIKIIPSGKGKVVRETK